MIEQRITISRYLCMDIVKFYISMAAVYIWRRAMWFRGFHSNADWLWTVLCVQCWQRNQRDCPTYRLEIHNSLLTTSALELLSSCQLQIHVYTLSCLYKIWVVSSHQCHLWSHLILTSVAYNYTFFLGFLVYYKPENVPIILIDCFGGLLIAELVGICSQESKYACILKEVCSKMIGFANSSRYDPQSVFF